MVCKCFQEWFGGWIFFVFLFSPPGFGIFLRIHCVFYVGCQVGAFCVCEHSEIHPVSAHCKCCCSCDQCRCSCVFWWCSSEYRAGFSSPLYQSFFTFWNDLFHITFLKHVWQWEFNRHATEDNCLILEVNKIKYSIVYHRGGSLS